MELDHILNSEEKALLEKINAKYKQHLAEQAAKHLEQINNDVSASGNPEPFNDAEPPRHITNYQREILVKIIAEISTVNEQGRLTDIDLCLEHYYHIPVPPDTDYKTNLTEFITIFDKHITDCAKKINHLDESK